MEADELERIMGDIRQGRGKLHVYRRSSNHLITLLVVMAGVALVVQKGLPPPGASLVLLILLWLLWLGLGRLFYRKTPIVSFSNAGVLVHGFPLMPWLKIEGMALDVRRYQSAKQTSLMLYVPSLCEFVLRPSLLRRLDYFLRGMRGERRIEVPLTYADVGAEALYQAVEGIWSEITGRKQDSWVWSPHQDDDEYEAWSRLRSKLEEGRVRIDEVFSQALDSGEHKGLLSRVMAHTQERDKEWAEFRAFAKRRRHQARVRGTVFAVVLIVGVALLIVLLESN